MNSNRKVRAQKIRRKLQARMRGVPRLTVFRSSRYIWAQIIDDTKGHTLVAASSRGFSPKDGTTKKERARAVGKTIARLALEKKIKKVVFDRGPYTFHGVVREVAEGAREGGLEF